IRGLGAAGLGGVLAACGQAPAAPSTAIRDVTSVPPAAPTSEPTLQIAWPTATSTPIPTPTSTPIPTPTLTPVPSATGTATPTPVPPTSSPTATRILVSTAPPRGTLVLVRR